MRRWIVKYRHDIAGHEDEKVEANSEDEAREKFMAGCVQPEMISIIAIEPDSLFMDVGTRVTTDLTNAGLRGTVNLIVADDVVRVEWDTASHNKDFVETLEFKENLQVVK